MFLKCFYIAVPYMYALLCVLHLCVLKDDDDDDCAECPYRKSRRDDLLGCSAPVFDYEL